MAKRFGILVLMLFTVGIVAMTLTTAESANQSKQKNFVAHLSGEEEVPPVETQATGQATFKLLKNGTVRFRLIVANIEDVNQVHIHLGAPGENGPIVVWLYPEGPPPELIPGRFNGVLATGIITDADLVGPLEGMTVADLIDEMRSGNTYVNVHTEANPDGEIRGQIH